MNPNYIDKDSILKFLRAKTDRPVSVREIAKSVGIPKTETRTLKKVLQSLINSGSVYKTKTGFYGLIDEMNLFTGSFEAHKDGYGFILAEKPEERDLFIPARKTMGAMSGDRVVARIESREKRDGSIIKILERAQKKVIGHLYQEKHFFYVKPKNRRIPFGILISPKDRAGAKHGDMVSVELTSYPTLTKPPEGKILKILTGVTEPLDEIGMIIEEHSMPLKFPSNIIAFVKELPDKMPSRGRTDCRDLLTVTIDGETAKDFDDAVSINRTDAGFVLYVHIADVGHYVPWDSPLDIEARRRGTSVYFPGSVIPMLPHELSDNLCSLLPKQDRLTFTAEMEFDKHGNILRNDFYPSIIHSNERMTYTAVKKILVDKDPAERQRYSYLLATFETMEELSNIIRDQRIRRGSLDFDLPEPEILLDLQGRPEAIVRAERNLAHMMIEDFMIAANEAVATHLEEAGVPALYRVHEKPDPSKLDELKPIFNALGFQIKKTGADIFQYVLKKTKGTAAESFLNIILLRSLKQAKYSPKNIGHFGLASTCYTHFTSPIRRYPDLVVHRILRETLGKNRPSKKTLQYLEEVLPEIATSSSKTERTADEVEREIVSAMRVWFMKDKVGEEYAGIVTNVTSHGLKIQLKEFFVEGFLHVSSMTDDYYWFDEKSYRLSGRRKKKSFTIGQEVTVRIELVDIEEREIKLGLA